jgi:hypothetical protein
MMTDPSPVCAGRPGPRGPDADRARRLALKTPARTREISILWPRPVIDAAAFQMSTMGASAGAPESSAIGDRAGHLGDAPRPGDASVRRPDVGDGLVGAAERPDFDARVEVLEAAQREGCVVAVEFEAAGLPGRTSDVETGGQPDDRSAVELERGDEEMWCADPKPSPADVLALGFELATARPDRCGPDRAYRHQRQR